MTGVTMILSFPLGANRAGSQLKPSSILSPTICTCISETDNCPLLFPVPAVALEGKESNSEKHTITIDI